MFLNNIKELFKSNNFHYFKFKKSESTMIDAKQYIEKGYKNFVIFANQQTAGKGRRGNKWISPPGNLYCSIVIENNLELRQHFLYSMIVSLSIQKTIKYFCPKKIEFKWPNDIFYNNKKFAGMILEHYQLTKKEKFVIIGLGLNYDSSPSNQRYKTTFLKEFLEINSIYNFINIFFDIFFDFLKNLNLDNNDTIRKKFTKSIMYLEKKITLLNHDDTCIKGIFKGIDVDGSMILEVDSKLINIYSGSIEI